MKLSTSKETNRFLNRKDQFQIFMLLAMLGIVLLAVKKTAEPEFWYWMFPPQATEDKADGEKTDDNRTDENSKTFREDDSRSIKISVSKFPTEDIEEENDSNELIKKNVRDFSAIKDDSLGVRHDEASIYYGLLDKISTLHEAFIQKESAKGVSYSVLVDHPDDYRGKLIEIEGNLRRLTLLPLLGVKGDGKRYYEGWIFTRSSGVEPYRVVCTEIDESLPLKQSYSEPVPVKVAGYFFKKQAYAAQKGLNSAPLVLAAKINRLIISTPKRQPISRLQKPIVWIVAILGLAVVLVLRSFRKSDSRSRLRMQRGKYLGQRLWVPETDEDEFVETEEPDDHWDDEETD